MKYITKGDLLSLLGDDAEKFTLFLDDPASFGVAGDLLTEMKIAAKQFGWTNGIDFGSARVQGLLAILFGYGIISQETINRLNDTPDLPEMDDIVVNMISQDDIIAENIGGTEYDGNAWRVEFEFANLTIQKMEDSTMKWSDDLENLRKDTALILRSKNVELWVLRVGLAFLIAERVYNLFTGKVLFVF